MVQLSHPHVTTGKTIALTRWSFVGKVISLLFNKLSRLVIAFFPRSKYLLISWLQSLSPVILESKERKSFTVSIVSLSTCHELMGSTLHVDITKWSKIKLITFFVAEDGKLYAVS